jgi:flagellar biosynthesis/type III secretory pathway protein FliH
VLTQSLGRLAQTHVVTNPQLQPGECRVLTQHGQIDQRLQTQLDRIESELA